MSQIEHLLKKFKDHLSMGDEPRDRTYFEIGPLSFNLALGDIRGIKSGRLAVITGKESTGKSTLALDAVKHYIKKFPSEYATWIDFERVFEADYARACGVDPARVIVVRPDTTEIGFDIVEELIKSGESRLVVLDSVAQAKPSSEDDRSYTESPKMASNAGLITRFCNRIIPLADNYDALVIAINQLRANFNTLSPEKEIMYGANSLKYAASLTILLRKKKTEEDRLTVEAIMRKNKVGSPMKKVDLYIDYGSGINHQSDIFELAQRYGIIDKRGSWFYYGDLSKQGEKRALAEFPMSDIRQAVIERITNELDKPS